MFLLEHVNVCKERILQTTYSFDFGTRKVSLFVQSTSKVPAAKRPTKYKDDKPSARNYFTNKQHKKKNKIQWIDDRFGGDWNK